jgi:hypothetical protein
MGFVYRDDIYKSVKEGHCPFLLGLVKNYEIVVSKDMGPYHW